MAEPSFLGDGVTPRRTDAKWFIWTKKLGEYQNRAGSVAANNPRKTDGLRIVKQKLLNAIRGSAYTG